MANSDFYTATKEDSRNWRTDQDSRASAKDTAAVANAEALQDEAHASNPVTTIIPDTTTTTATAATGSSHTRQIVITGQISTTGDYPYPVVVTYASSSTGIATVDSTGLITGVDAGTATITVTAVHNTTVTTAVTVVVS